MDVGDGDNKTQMKCVATAKLERRSIKMTRGKNNGREMMRVDDLLFGGGSLGKLTGKNALYSASWKFLFRLRRLSNFECTTHTHISRPVLFIKFEAKAITKSTARTKSNFTHLLFFCFFYFFARQLNCWSAGERLYSGAVSAGRWWWWWWWWRSLEAATTVAAVLSICRAGSQLILIAVAVINGGSVTCVILYWGGFIAGHRGRSPGIIYAWLWWWRIRDVREM